MSFYIYFRFFINMIDVHMMHIGMMIIKQIRDIAINVNDIAIG
ncbi:hypothetical protein [Staphylococcus sp. 50Mo3-2]